MVAKKSGDKRREEGQALFEFIVFLPFLLFVLIIMYTVGNAINGSINQQKATRRYFFYINKGNSTLPTAGYLRDLANDGIELAGAMSVGWREKASGETSYATCYSLPTLFGKSDDDDCDKPSLDDGRSNFVRIYTQFGVCGETYSTFGGDVFASAPMARARASSCLLSK